MGGSDSTDSTGDSDGTGSKGGSDSTGTEGSATEGSGTAGRTAEPPHGERAGLLLGSPLGRQLLAGFVGDDLEEELFRSLGLGEIPGSARFTLDPETGKTIRMRRRKRREWHQAPAGEVRAVLRAAMARGEWQRLAELSATEALDELALVSQSFGFGGGDVAMWGLTALAAEELRPAATALAASPGTSGWWDPVRRADQRQLVRGKGGGGLAGIEDAMRHDMEKARRDHRQGMRHRFPIGERDVGALWYSSPDFADGTWTTGPHADLPTIELRGFSDVAPLENGTATVLSLTVDERARVAEIRRPGDWRDLVARFPREVTGTHDGEWRSWGDVDGPWYLPDWEAVAESYDGVHVTIGGYVAACGLVQPVVGGYTVLAGWVPDATLWLRDVSAGSRRLGTWRGDPEDVGDWDAVREGWSPEAAQA